MKRTTEISIGRDILWSMVPAHAGLSEAGMFAAVADGLGAISVKVRGRCRRHWHDPVAGETVTLLCTFANAITAVEAKLKWDGRIV